MLKDLQKEKDERNIAINNKAKAKGFDAMSFILTILMLIFVFLNADLSIILLLVFAYLLVYGVFIFYLNKYYKETGNNIELEKILAMECMNLMAIRLLIGTTRVSMRV